MTAADLLSSPATPGELVPATPAFPVDSALAGEAPHQPGAGFGEVLEQALEPIQTPGAGSANAHTCTVRPAASKTEAAVEAPDSADEMTPPTELAKANSERVDGRRSSRAPLNLDQGTEAGLSISLDARTARTTVPRKTPVRTVASQSAVPVEGDSTDSQSETSPASTTLTKTDLSAAEAQVAAMFLNVPRPVEPPKPALIPLAATCVETEVDAMAGGDTVAAAGARVELANTGSAAAVTSFQAVRPANEGDIRDPRPWSATQPNLGNQPGQANQASSFTGSTPRERGLNLSPRMGAGVNSSVIPSFVPQTSASLTLDTTLWQPLATPVEAPSALLAAKFAYTSAGAPATIFAPGQGNAVENAQLALSHLAPQTVNDPAAAQQILPELNTQAGAFAAAVTSGMASVKDNSKTQPTEKENVGSSDGTGPVRPVKSARQHGTDVAKFSATMNKSDKQNENASSNEQKLPDAFAPMAPAEEGAEFKAETPRSARFAGTEAVKADWSMTSDVGPTHRATALESTEIANVNAAPPIEKLHRLINDEVKVIKQLNPDTLAVVLKPDGNTEILLQVHIRNGQIEAHARCERGDFNGLSAQWDSLQQSLAGQGVKLMPLSESLTSSSVTSHHPGSGFDSQAGGRNGQQSRQTQEFQMDTAGNSLPAAKTNGRKTEASASRAREWWA